MQKQKKIPVDLAKLLNKKFKDGMNILGKRSFSTSIVKKLLENECNIKMSSKKFPKKLIDNEKNTKEF